MGDDGVGVGMSFGFDTRGEGERGGKQAGDDAPQVSLGGSRSGEYQPLPLRILALANFRGAPDQRDGRILSVDKDELDALPGRMEVQLFFDVKDTLRNDPKGIEVRYHPKTIKDLRPDAVAKGIPQLDAVRKLLDELDAVSQGSMSADQFRSGLSIYSDVPALSEAIRLAEEALAKRSGGAPAAAPPPSAPAQSSGDDAVDSILAMVAAPGEDASEPPPPPPEKTSKLGGLISAVARSARGQSSSGSGGARGLDGARASAQAVLSRQLDLVYHHPQFREVEAAWLGLELMVKRIPGRPARIQITDGDPSALADAFHEHVFPAEYAGQSDAPLSLTLVDRSFDNTAAHLAELQQLAADAEQIQAPVVGSVSRAFLGVESMAELGRMSNPSALFETGFASWEGFRKTEPSRWLALTCNRILLREPYRAGTRRSRHYSEQVADAGDLLWGSGCWALGVTAARSQEELGWPTALAGMQRGRLDEIPMWTDGAGEQHGPLEAALSEDAVTDLGNAGLIGLAPESGRDVVLVMRTPVARAAEGEPRQRINLAYQLFAARLGETILRFKANLAGASGSEAAQAKLQAFLEGVVGDTGPGAGARVQVREEGGRRIAQMTIRAGAVVLGGTELELAIPL